MAKKRRRRDPNRPWYYDYLESRIRQIFGWSPQYRQARRRATDPEKLENQICEACSVSYPRKQTQVDHIVPVVNPHTGFDSWTDIINRALHVTVDDLAVLCKPCHLKKSKSENEIRYETRRRLKKESEK